MDNYITPITIGIILTTALALGKKYWDGGVCRLNRNLSGKIIIVTGSTAGIGEETARGLAAHNATVILAARSQERADIIIEDVKKSNKNAKIEFVKLDLSDLKSIKQFVKVFKQKYSHLDVLINNAGALGFAERTITKDGFEMTFGTNHIGHFYLTLLLLDSLKKSEDGRIINVAAKLVEQNMMRWDDLNFEKDYSWLAAYSQSKISNVLFAKELQKRLKDTNVKAVSLHPGVVRTEIWRYMVEKIGWKVALIILYPALLYFAKSKEQGSQTTLYCAMEDFDKLKGGAYYADCREKAVSSEALDATNQERLWKVTEKMILEKLGEDAFKS